MPGRRLTRFLDTSSHTSLCSDSGVPRKMRGDLIDLFLRFWFSSLNVSNSCSILFVGWVSLCSSSVISSFRSSFSCLFSFSGSFLFDFFIFLFFFVFFVYNVLIYCFFGCHSQPTQICNGFSQFFVCCLDCSFQSFNGFVCIGSKFHQLFQVIPLKFMSYTCFPLLHLFWGPF